VEYDDRQKERRIKMKKEKMQLFIQRLPNDGLLELQEILSKEFQKRSLNCKYNLKKFQESMLPKEMINTK